MSDKMTREEAIDVLKHNYPSACFTDLCEAVEIAIQALSAQPERKKGKWIDNETSYADGVRQTCTCSICGQRSVRPLGRFCRWCGADVGGDKDDQC